MVHPSPHLFSAMYAAMHAALGPSRWWPAQTPFEVAIGAILTQNTNWNNVQKAIDNLRANDLLSAQRLSLASDALLEACIRPSGFFRQKTLKIRHFLRFLEQQGALDMDGLREIPTDRLRADLLAVKGIGPETADSILLYALNRPVFVVDAYTARICQRHALVPEEVSYHELQELFMNHLDADPVLYNEFHALLVRVGKDWCRKRTPRCPGCPLRDFLPEGGGP